MGKQYGFEQSESAETNQESQVQSQQETQGINAQPRSRVNGLLVGIIIVLAASQLVMLGVVSRISRKVDDSMSAQQVQTEAASTLKKEEPTKTSKTEQKEELIDVSQTEATPADTQQPEIMLTQEPESVTYQDVDIESMFDALDQNALNAKNTYEGQRIRFTAVLRNIDASGSYFSVNNGDEWSLDGIYCSIKDEDTLNRIASASVGDTLTICGTVSSVGEILGYSVDVDYIE